MASDDPTPPLFRWDELGEGPTLLVGSRLVIRAYVGEQLVIEQTPEQE